MIPLLRHLLFALGLLAGIVVWFVENPDPSSWIGRALAPRHALAITGYRTLLKQTPLSSQDQGFAELLEIATIVAPEIVRGRVAAFRVAGLDVVPSGNGIYVQLLDADGLKVDVVTILNPETAIKQHFFDAEIRRAKWVLSVVSLVLSAIMYIVEVAERRRMEQRDRAEKTRVNGELVAARAELSKLKAQQAPGAILDTVKEELRRQERRGGGKSPFPRQ